MGGGETPQPARLSSRSWPGTLQGRTPLGAARVTLGLAPRSGDHHRLDSTHGRPRPEGAGGTCLRTPGTEPRRLGLAPGLMWLQRPSAGVHRCPHPPAPGPNLRVRVGLSTCCCREQGGPASPWSLCSEPGGQPGPHPSRAAPAGGTEPEPSPALLAAQRTRQTQNRRVGAAGLSCRCAPAGACS